MITSTSKSLYTTRKISLPLFLLSFFLILQIAFTNSTLNRRLGDDDKDSDDKKESEILFLSGGYGARHRFNIVVLKMLDAVLRGEVQEAGDVDDITEQLANMSMNNSETKTSAPANAPAKKKKARKKKPPEDSDDEDDTPPPPRERSTRRRRRNRKYDDSLSKEEMDAL